MRNLFRHLTGNPLPTQQLKSEKLSIFKALAAFSPDALSSIAYANQEIFLGLVIAGSAGLVFAWPIALAITAMIIIVAISYFQTIPAYPHGGGSYTVARKNLGKITGLVAASALLVDYVLTAAVSLTAGVEAIASAFPALWSYRVSISLLILFLITLANLRGLRESGTLMSIPVYLFILSYLVLIIFGLIQARSAAPSNFVSTAPPPSKNVSLFLLLHTFASGCTALTGIEVISNGIPAFKPPSVKNAQITLLLMAALMGSLFLGTIGLTQYFAVVPDGKETILSALASRIFGAGPLYLLVQISTLLILSVAANSSFAGFPRLACVLSQDHFLPSQFANRGDRLVYTNGIISLSILTGFLIIVFQGDSHSLIPLFAVGVFLAFTLSQAGMVVHWWNLRQDSWLVKALVNGFGALVTLTTLGIIAISKFFDGAWFVIVLIPSLVFILNRIHEHYQQVSQELALHGKPEAMKAYPKPRIVIPISPIVHRGTVEALRYAKSISRNVTALYIEIDPSKTAALQQKWEKWGQNIPLVIVPSPYRSMVGPFLEYLNKIDEQAADGQRATVLLPEFVPANFWHNLLHNQSAVILRLALLYDRKEKGYTRAIIDVPFHLWK